MTFALSAAPTALLAGHGDGVGVDLAGVAYEGGLQAALGLDKGADAVVRVASLVALCVRDGRREGEGEGEREEEGRGGKGGREGGREEGGREEGREGGREEGREEENTKI